MSNTPITFTEPSYALLDVEHNGVLTTQLGCLAVFSTQGMANAAAASTKRIVQVISVRVLPVGDPTIKSINPESAMLQQSEGMWMKYCALLLAKLGGGKAVSITAQDLQATIDAPPCTVLVHGHKDRIDFKLVTMEEAERLAAHDRATNVGHA